MYFSNSGTHSWRTPPSEACAVEVQYAQWWKNTMTKSMSCAARYFFSCASNHVVWVPPERPRLGGISKETSLGSSEMIAVLP